MTSDYFDESSYKENMVGRDFILRDIDGQFMLRLIAMKRLNFNAAVDRLFIVKDLPNSDDGSKSLSDFLKLPHIHYVDWYYPDVLTSLNSGYFNKINGSEWVEVENGLGWWISVPRIKSDIKISWISRLWFNLSGQKMVAK